MEDGFLKSILYHPHCKNPLFLSTLLDEIRVDGDKGLYDKVLDYVNSKDIEDLFLKKIERLERDYGQESPGLVKDALSLLWASRNGLSEAELLDLLGNGEKLSSSIWSPFYLAMESNFVKRSGFICLFHQFLRAAVEKKYLPSEKDKKYYHNKIAEYFHENKLILSQKRIFQELPWQLMKAKEWHSLYSLLQDFSFVSPMWNYDPYIIKSYWVSLEEEYKTMETRIYRRINVEKGFPKNVGNSGTLRN